MEIEFKHVNYIYSPNTPFSGIGLKDVDFKLKSGGFIAVIGHTGSGKSTLLQHFNALLKPTSGQITIGNHIITPETSNKNLKSLRKQVGMVFQFPESQLFEETVQKDIAFGPKNFGVSEKDANALTKTWLKKVGLNQNLLEQSPFDLSGGQMRRVAIAGVLASEPDVLLLDEPTAGLDPVGRLDMMKIFADYQRAGHTVILVTHNMDDVANYADDVLVMEHGQLLKHAEPKLVFADSKWLLKHHLDEPTASRVAAKFMAKGFTFDQQVLTLTDLAKQLVDQIKSRDLD